MDLEEAREFRERCTQCAAVSWGLTDEGRYYCTSCHNVTDRSKEVLSTEAMPNAKIQAINRGLKRKKKLERGWDWYVCEGFQHILYQQAEALQTLGVSPELKSQVLHNLWRRYLQKSKLAYCRNPVYTSRRAAESSKGTFAHVEEVKQKTAETLKGIKINEFKNWFEQWKIYLDTCIVSDGEYKFKHVSEDNPSHSGWDSEPELLSDFSGPSVFDSGAESQPDAHARKPFPTSRASQSDMSSICSGSLDGVEYSLRKAKGTVKMTVPGTLALCSLALLWQREAVTLSDLLRLVEEGRVPYVNAFQHFPEEMKLYGRDKAIFAVEVLLKDKDIWSDSSRCVSLHLFSFPRGTNGTEFVHDESVFKKSWPTYEDIYKKMVEVATFLDLPRFPDITEDCYLHPNILCMKYLMEVNLPDEMYNFTYQVVKMAGIGEVDFLTFDPIAKKKNTVKYDIQAVAVIVIVLKLLFLLDDNLEWSLSTIAEKYNEENKEDKPWFDFRKWYQVMKKSFDEKKQKWEEARAKYMWKSEKPLYHSSIDRSVVYKRREMVVNLQKQFSTLADSTPTLAKKSSSSFQFNWTGDTDGTCFHGHSLQGALERRGPSLRTRNALYWLSTQKFCKSYCKHVTTYEESNFSLSYQFILNLFSFLLRINAYFLHEEVSLIEKRLFKTKYSKAKKKSSRSRKVRK